MPLFVLNQVSEERCEWLVPGMLRDKVQALLRPCTSVPRSRLVPLPETATKFAETLNAPERFGHNAAWWMPCSKLVRDATSLDIVRGRHQGRHAHPHHFMNFRVVDEHGRQLGHGRNLGALKAEWGKTGAARSGAGFAQAVAKPERAPIEMRARWSGGAFCAGEGRVRRAGDLTERAADSSARPRKQGCLLSERSKVKRP